MSTNDNITFLRKPCPACQALKRAITLLADALAAETDADELALLEKAERYMALADGIVAMLGHTGAGPDGHAQDRAH